MASQFQPPPIDGSLDGQVNTVSDQAAGNDVGDVELDSEIMTFFGLDASASFDEYLTHLSSLQKGFDVGVQSVAGAPDSEKSIVEKASDFFKKELWGDKDVKKLLVGAGLQGIGAMATYNDKKRVANAQIAQANANAEATNAATARKAAMNKNRSGLIFNTPKPAFNQPTLHAPKVGG
jgi:hypothetical protein